VNLDLKIDNIMPKDKLHPKFWYDITLHEAIQDKLMSISVNIMKNIEISDFVDDIILTGSISSYNWHSLSDIDVHFVFDFRKIDENTDLVKKMLDLTRMKWNKDHKILIFNHEVEIYFQDSNEDHESMGVYSLLRKEWIENPVVASKRPSSMSVAVKSMAIIREIDRLQELYAEKRYKEVYLYSKNLKNKIKNMRTSGLSREGVFSVENLTFKTLRNNEKLGILGSLKNLSYDKMMSIDKIINVKFKR